MTPADKEKLKTAFNAAVNASPYADEEIVGLTTTEGKSVTRRIMIELLLQDEALYADLDRRISSGKMTLDQFIGEFQESMKQSYYGASEPPETRGGPRRNPSHGNPKP
jgi:hypothetical protein